jgi:hypothetical protein
VCWVGMYSFCVELYGGVEWVWNAGCSGCVLGRGLRYVIIDSFGDILKVTACDWAEAVR